MNTLGNLIETHGVPVEEHHDLEQLVPIHSGMQRQGDVIVIPSAKARATTPVPAAGVPVVKGEAGGNTHLLLADGPVFCDVKTASARNLTLADVVIPEGSVAYLAHPEHAYTGIAPGNYTIRRQREQADELRLVAD